MYMPFGCRPQDEISHNEDEKLVRRPFSCKYEGLKTTIRTELASVADSTPQIADAMM